MTQRDCFPATNTLNKPPLVHVTCRANNFAKDIQNVVSSGSNFELIESMWELIPFRTSPHTTQQTARRETKDIVDENDGLTLMLNNFCWIEKQRNIRQSILFYIKFLIRIYFVQPDIIILATSFSALG